MGPCCPLSAPVYVDGRLATTLKGGRIAENFAKLLGDYVVQRWGAPATKV